VSRSTVRLCINESEYFIVDVVCARPGGYELEHVGKLKSLLAIQSQLTGDEYYHGGTVDAHLNILCQLRNIVSHWAQTLSSSNKERVHFNMS
jgi:hypothetical protein